MGPLAAPRAEALDQAPVDALEPRMGFRPHALASLSNDGAVITRLLERCGFVVFRGGSSKRDSRRVSTITDDLIDHMRTTDGQLERDLIALAARSYDDFGQPRPANLRAPAPKQPGDALMAFSLPR